ncbi:MAG: hypothetical protein K8R37_10100 [Bacteroidales bacterium]|nr:hypothetical protein [Bacteroidales bacterium]
MKIKLTFVSAIIMIMGLQNGLFAQLQDEKSVTITMDLQPILHLDMETADQIEFVFDDIKDYYAGITKYGATILKVSATVSWDLYAVGRSNGTIGPEFWDQIIDYGSGSGTNTINQLPLSAVELHQSQPNNGAAGAGITATYIDYSTPFPASTVHNGANSLYVNNGTLTPPTVADKYIAGHSGTTGLGDDAMTGGSYLTAGGYTSDYYYVIDYRLMPGLPAIFPNAFDADAAIAEDLVTVNGANSYAEPGVYTMYVQYVLVEDQ